MNSLLKVVAFSLVLVITATLLKEMGFHGSKLLTTLGCVFILIFLVDGISAVGNTVSKIAGIGKISKFSKEALKIVAISYVFGFCSDFCQDLGESSVSNCMLVVGRVEILVVSLPYIEEIIHLAERAFSL